jgi:hypothetical protein
MNLHRHCMLGHQKLSDTKSRSSIIAIKESYAKLAYDIHINYATKSALRFIWSNLRGALIPKKRFFGNAGTALHRGQSTQSCNNYR